MTPETRSSTHFFWNYLHDFDIDNPNITLSLRHSLEEGFNEDKAIIEAQQKVFDADPDYQMLAIRADAALSHFRWALDQRIHAGTGGLQARAQRVAFHRQRSDLSGQQCVVALQFFVARQQQFHAFGNLVKVWHGG